MYLMIDNYDSFTYNLQALFNECNADITIVKNDRYLPADQYQGIIISPGPSSPKNSGTTLRYISEYLGRKPIFGVCLGMQAIAYSLGYAIIQAGTVKHGKLDKITVTGSSVLFSNMPGSFSAVRYHSLAVDIDDHRVTSRSMNDGTVMSIEDCRQKFFGVQFHPESILSEFGGQIVRNFLDFAAVSAASDIEQQRVGA